MSGLDRLLILSPKDAEDVADIFQYSLETWGETQAYVYRDVLDRALLTIQDNPRIGHGRPELSAQHRIFPAGWHTIVYHVTTGQTWCPESCTGAWILAATYRT